MDHPFVDKVKDTVLIQKHGQVLLSEKQKCSSHVVASE